MLVHLAGIGRSPSATEALTELARRDQVGHHRVTDDPADADAVIFSDLHLLPHDVGLATLRRHPTYRQHADRCYVYDERDHPWENMPGLYVSMPRAAFNPDRMVAAPYYTLRRPVVPEVDEPQLLFSFLGARSHPLRSRVLALRHERAVVEDTSGFVFYDDTGSSAHRQRQRFADVLADSKFVLCPRGAGTASIRLFETLAVGRVPVIISDDWVPPPGPEWDRISIRVPQRDVDQLPSILEGREDEWTDLASGAAEAFDRYFSQDVAWNNLMDCLAPLVGNHEPAGFARPRLSPQRVVAETVHARWCARAHVGRLLRRLHPGGSDRDGGTGRR